MNTAFYWSPSLMWTLLYPQQMSILENNDAPFTRFISSGMSGKGYRLRMVHWLNFR